MSRVGSPLPFEPQRPGVIGIEIVFDRETHVASKFLRTFILQQVMVRIVGNRLGDQGGRAHTLEAGDRPGTFFRSVHATGIERHDPVGVG